MKFRKSIKKIFSLLLCLYFVLGIISVRAQDEEEGEAKSYDYTFPYQPLPESVRRKPPIEFETDPEQNKEVFTDNTLEFFHDYFMSLLILPRKFVKDDYDGPSFQYSDDFFVDNDQQVIIDMSMRQDNVRDWLCATQDALNKTDRVNTEEPFCTFANLDPENYPDPVGDEQCEVPIDGSSSASGTIGKNFVFPLILEPPPQSFENMITAGTYDRTTRDFDTTREIIGSNGQRQIIGHNALDFSYPKGTPIIASNSGVVVISGTDRLYGEMVMIEHEFSGGRKMRTLYAHMSERLVENGDFVEPDPENPIGLVGTTGNSTGNHLHFEIHECTGSGGSCGNGTGGSSIKKIDPEPRITFDLASVIDDISIECTTDGDIRDGYVGNDAIKATIYEALTDYCAFKDQPICKNKPATVDLVYKAIATSHSPQGEMGGITAFWLENGGTCNNPSDPSRSQECTTHFNELNVRRFGRGICDVDNLGSTFYIDEFGFETNDLTSTITDLYPCFYYANQKSNTNFLNGWCNYPDVPGSKRGQLYSGDSLIDMCCNQTSFDNTYNNYVGASCKDDINSSICLRSQQCALMLYGGQLYSCPSLFKDQQRKDECEAWGCSTVACWSGNAFVKRNGIDVDNPPQSSNPDYEDIDNPPPISLSEKHSCPNTCTDCSEFPVTKVDSLRSDYVPSVSNSGLPDGGVAKNVTSETQIALQGLFTEAQNQGINMYISSAYRGYQTQKATFDQYVSTEMTKDDSLTEEQAIELVNTYSAKPGHSEHQLGTTVDINCVGCVKFVYEPRNVELYEFLDNNVGKYGFIVSYREEHTSVTGFKAEPWHIRYVGKSLAQEYENSGMSVPFQEFLINKCEN